MVAVVSTAVLDRMPIQTPAQVLTAYAASLARVQTLSGSSVTQFTAVYTPLAQALAGYVQHLPCVYRTDHSLLSARLEQAAQVLLRRQGVLLPPGAPPERLAREADLWTYVAYSVALLRGLAADVAPWTITLWSLDDTARGVWQPWTAPRGLATVDAAAYRVRRALHPPGADWTPLLVGALMPPAGLNWLWREPAIWQVWQQALTAAEWREPLKSLFVDA